VSQIPRTGPPNPGSYPTAPFAFVGGVAALLTVLLVILAGNAVIEWRWPVVAAALVAVVAAGRAKRTTP
jgi:hypothetical protein